MKELFAIDDETGAFQLYPHRFQCEALDSTAARIFMLKGMQGGATSFMPHWLLQEMRRCGPGNRALSYLAITPTLQVARNKLIPELERIFCDILGYGKYIKAPKPCIEINKKGQRDLWGHEQREPTHIYFCYAEDSDSFAGFTALACIGDEIGQKKFKKDAWIELQARLSTPSGMLAPNNAKIGFPAGIKMGRFCGGSTVYQLGWLEDLWNEWERCVQAGIPTPLHFIRFDSTENPAFPAETWDLAKATLPDWLFDMRYRAIFRRPAGIIYDCWDPATMVIDATPAFGPDNLPRSFTIDVSMDFGKRNFRAGFWAHDVERDRHFLIGSHQDSQNSNEDRAKAILAEAARRGWALESACGGQPSENDERAEMAAGGLIVLPPAYKPLWTGISNFYAAIKLGKVRAFRGACPGFEEEIKNYSRPINDATGEVLLDEDPEDKETYHCFVAGTLISAARGDVPIEQIAAGDLVFTRAGLRRVCLSIPNGIKDTYTVTFSNNRSITGTADHPVWVDGKGWVRIDALEIGDRLQILPDGVQPCRTDLTYAAMKSAFRARYTFVTPILRIIQTAATSSGKARTFTARCGKLLMAPYRKASTFTTKIRTLSTIPWKTLSWSNAPHIRDCMAVNAASASGPIWTYSAPSQPHGTEAPKGEHGTASKPPKRRLTANRLSELVAIAMRFICPRPCIKVAFARITASQAIGRKPAPTTCSALARLAACFLPSTSTNERSVVPVSVVGVSAAPVQQVYNLTVEGQPEFFANGVLVHNCLDHARYRFTRKFNPLLSAGANLSAGGDKVSTPAPAAQHVHTEALRASNGTSPLARGMASRYGLQPGRHLDIDL